MQKRNFTIAELKNTKCAHLNSHITEEIKIKKRSKYGAVKTEVDGVVFDSAKEAGRYLQLRMLKMAGLIHDLRLQVPYQLNEGGSHSVKYIADFVYQEVASGETIVEDVKGYRTKEYKKKRRLMENIYGIKIKEV